MSFPKACVAITLGAGLGIIPGLAVDNVGAGIAAGAGLGLALLLVYQAAARRGQR